MRRFRSTRVLLVLFALALPVVTVAFTRPGAQEPQQTAKAGESTPAVKKEDLRYNGKPFVYWRNYWRTELKAECRIDFLRAMAAFGTNGYAEEATMAIIEFVKTYGDEDLERYPEPTLNQRVIEEAGEAVAKIGSRAAPILLRDLSSPIARKFAFRMMSCWGPLASKGVPEGVIPRLVNLLQCKEPEIRKLVLDILDYSIIARPEFKAKLLTTIIDRPAADSFVKFLAAALRRPESEGFNWSEQDLASRILKASGIQRKDLLPVVIEVLNAEAIRCKKEVSKPQAYYYRINDDGSKGEKVMIPNQREGLMGFAEQLIEWIGDLGPRAKTAAPTLVSLFDVANDDGRAVITKTLGQIGARIPTPKAPSPLDGAFLNTPRNLQRVVASWNGRIASFLTAR